VTGAWLLAGLIVGAAWLAGCGSSPSCQGDPIPCAEYRSPVACQEQVGCSWWETVCEGTSAPLDCHALADPRSCEGSANQCRWSDADGACSGLTNCIFQRLRESCEHLGCSWSPDQCHAVRGPITCSDLDQNQCGRVLGCAWK
jgi:hypothetical protein